MKDKIIKIGFSTIVLSLLMLSLVTASLSTLGTGYAVSSNVDGKKVSGGTPVTITAATLDNTVTQVTFRWFGPPEGNGNLEYEETVYIFRNDTIGYWDEGTPTEQVSEISYAQSSYFPSHGEWRVEVIFHARSEKNDVAQLSQPVDVTQNHSFFVIPETSLGTIGATVAMMAALCMFILKKRPKNYAAN